MPKEEFHELMNGLVAKYQSHQKQIEDQRLENERLKKEAEERNASIEAARKEQAATSSGIFVPLDRSVHVRIADTRQISDLLATPSH
jgi:cell division septum initiation protein DivIVA